MRAIIDAIFGTRLPRSRWPGDGAPKKGEIGPSLAAISVRIEGPVNWRRAPAMPGPPCGNHGPSPPRRATQVPADPLLRAIISAKNPLILAPFPQSRWPGAVVRKKGGIKPTLSARTARKAPPVKQRRDVRDFRRTIGDHGQSPPGRTTFSQCEKRGKGGLSLTPSARACPYTEWAEDTPAGVSHPPISLKPHRGQKRPSRGISR